MATGLAKLELFNHLRLPAPLDGEPFPPGYVHLPKVDAEFLKQLCAEQLVTRRDRRGYARREWQKTRERNEALDCYVYARATAAILGLDRMSDRHWRQRAAELGCRWAITGRGAADGRATAGSAPGARPAGAAGTARPATHGSATTTARRCPYILQPSGSWLGPPPHLIATSEWRCYH